MEPEIQGRVICVESQMNTFNYFYRVTILQLVLRQWQFIQSTLQKSCFISSQKKEIADLTLQTMYSLQSESELEILWQKTIQQAEVLEITQPSLPRKKTTC